MYIGLHVKCPLFLTHFNKIWIFSIGFPKKYLNLKFHEKPSGERRVRCDQTNTRRRNFSVAPKNFLKEQDKDGGVDLKFGSKK